MRSVALEGSDTEVSARILCRMKMDLKLPSFEDATDWLNRPASSTSKTISPEEITRATRGRLTLVHFWSTSSNPSKLNLTQIGELRDHRKRVGLRVIAVHVPGFDAEKDPAVVGDAIGRLNLTEPCALDNDLKLSATFQNTQAIVPAYYLFDHEGSLKNFSTGERGVSQIEDDLDQLLSELRDRYPFCPDCEWYLSEEALYCSECGMPLILPGSEKHPYYENHHSASLPTVRLVNPDPLIGRVIDGKYELLAGLGQGGMAAVYRARRVHIGDEVAVKVLLQKFVSDEAALARFRREARAAAMLRHPNIITIHDFGETDVPDAPAFIVMEFVRGTPLRDLLDSEVQFSVPRAVRLMRAICAGVGAAHRQGVIHRDLKPENIHVLAPDDDYEFESVRVLDFGLAKLLDRSESRPSQALTVVGTPYYMSPEQCLGEPLDARSDVYSLGAMMYEMLTGQRPFAAETVSGVINKHLYESPPPLPSSLTIPRKVASAIMQALAKQPAERPQTATEFGRQLQLITNGF